MYLLQKRLSPRLVQEIILFQQLVQQVALSHALLVPEIILSQLVVRFRVHRHVRKEALEVARHDQEWPDLVQVQYVQVLQHVHHHRVQQVHQVRHRNTHHVQVLAHLQLVEIIVQAHHRPAQHQVVHQVVHRVAVVQVAVVQQEHLERMQVNLQSANQNQEKRCVMNSTTCKRQNLAALLFLMVMERLKYVCVVVHPLLTSPKRSMQIQQHS